MKARMLVLAVSVLTLTNGALLLAVSPGLGLVCGVSAGFGFGCAYCMRLLYR